MYENYIKRGIDIIMSILLLLILSFIGVVIMIIIKLTSKGPIFFRQIRFGKRSKQFILYKFRTMQMKTPELANSEFSNIYDYMTPVGEFLRKTSLDELPQLINILKGEMSFIGPRPLAKTDIKVVELRQVTGADLVRPGISGLAQINGRNNITDIEKANYDAKYAGNITLLNDIKILLMTIINVVAQRNINKSI